MASSRSASHNPPARILWTFGAAGNWQRSGFSLQFHKLAINSN